MRQYLAAVREILTNGTRKPSRTGVDTLSTFNINYEIDLQRGFPLLTTKKISWKNIVVEMLWFLSGRKDIGILKKHDCKFWDSWADERTGEVPSAYGNFWRRFPVHVQSDGSFNQAADTYLGFNDQIVWAIDELKRNPMSRRVNVTAWAPGNAQTSKLPPCHMNFTLNVQLALAADFKGHGLEEPRYEPRLCLHLTQRSCDVALGVPYNIASYALLLALFARFTGIEAGTFAHTLVDAHAYTSKADGSMAEFDHVPGLRQQLERDPRPLPKLVIDPAIKTLADVERLLEEDTITVMRHFVLEGYDPHPPISFKVAV